MVPATVFCHLVTATIGFFVAMAVAVHQGNLFRTLISGVIIMGITLWIATQTIGLHTQLAANAGTLKAGGMVASMDRVVRRLRLLIQLFTGKMWLASRSSASSIWPAFY